jgi:iron complex transport system substrate-binding protein
MKQGSKYLIIFILVVILASGCSGCNHNNTDYESPAESTRTVIDCIGRRVSIPEHVEKIGCLYAFAGHVTVMLGEERKIVAVVDGLKRDALLTGMFPDLLDKAVPYTDGSINVEELVKLDPDVVFIRRSTSENPGEMKKLEAFHIPALVIDSNTIQEQRTAVQVVGEVCGEAAMEKAKLYDEIYRQAMDIAAEKKAKLHEDEIVSVFHSINEATRTDAQNTLPAEWTDLVGVRNVSVGKELNLLEGKMYAGLEQIYLWDPQVIICNEPGVADYMKSDGKWAELQAIKSGKVYQMPIAISRWGHPGSVETPLAIYWLGKLVYPQLYSDIDLENETRNFYQTFFHYNLDQKELNSIFAGEGMRVSKEQLN